MKTRRLELVIDAVTPSLNEKLHWAAYGRLKNSLQTKVAEALYAASASTQTPVSALQMRGRCKAEVEITSYRHAILDHDNLIGGAKPLIDALRDLHLIVDDKPEWLVAVYDCQVDRKSKRTVIAIEWDEEEAVTPPRRVHAPKPVPKPTTPSSAPAAKEDHTMFAFDSDDAEIRSLSILDRVDGDGDALGIKVKVRLQLGVSLSDTDVEQLPHVSEAVKLLLTSSRAIQDEPGPNTISIAIKRPVPTCRYRLTHDRLVSSFVGEPVLQPKVLIVEGTVGMIWSVEAQVDVLELPDLASLVGLDQLELKSHPLQGDLFGVEKAVA